MKLFLLLLRYVVNITVFSLSIGKHSTKGSKPVQGASITHKGYNSKITEEHQYSIAIDTMIKYKTV